MSASNYVAFSEPDYKRLMDVAALYSSPYSEILREELKRGYVLDRRSVPANLITMNSTVRYMDLTTGAVRRVTLVYPQDADPERGWISVLSPLGVVLIGLSAGQEIYWRRPQGIRAQIRVLRVEGQPKVSGERL